MKHRSVCVKNPEAEIDYNSYHVPGGWFRVSRYLSLQFLDRISSQLTLFYRPAWISEEES